MTDQRTKSAGTKRRTQKERSDATRERIMQAALKTLLERGYAGASTWAVCETGGFSKGTLLHHFRRRSDLFQTLLTELSQTYLQGLHEAIENARNGDKLSIFMEWVWSTLEGPFFVLGLEILTASRTDPELVDVTRPGADVLAKLLDDFIEDVVASAATSDKDALRSALRTTIHMSRGIGLDLAIGGDRDHHKRRFDDWSETVFELASA